MFVVPENERMYPTFASYVEEYLPSHATNRLVIEGARRFGQITPDQLRRALDPRNKPSIYVVDLPSSSYLGGFAKKLPGSIAIQRRLVEQFEAGKMFKLRMLNGAPILAVGVVLLHELMHWGDWNYNQKKLDGEGPYHMHEAGHDFEIFIMGGILPRQVAPWVQRSG